MTDQESEAPKMDETVPTSPVTSPTAQGAVEAPGAPSRPLTPEERRTIIITAVVMVLVLAALIAGTVILVRQSPATVAFVRDVFLIFLAFQSLVLGLALIIMIIQLARLINLLQNEIRPILNSTNETVSNLRGTTAFLSDNLVQPVIKLNEYLAGLSQFLQLVGLVRKKTPSKISKGE